MLQKLSSKSASSLRVLLLPFTVSDVRGSKSDLYIFSDDKYLNLVIVNKTLFITIRTYPLIKISAQFFVDVFHVNICNIPVYYL